MQTHCAAIRVRLLEPFYHGDNKGLLAPTHLRCQQIWDCLGCTHLLCGELCEISFSQFPFLTFVPILHAALATVKAFRLLCFQDKVWELGVARDSFKFPILLQQLRQGFQLATHAGHPRCEIIVCGRPVFLEYAEAYRAIELWYNSRVIADEEESNEVWKEPTDVCPDVADFWHALFDLTDVPGS